MSLANKLVLIYAFSQSVPLPQEKFKFITPKSTNRKDFLEEAKSGAFNGCDACLRTFDSVSITDSIDRELIQALPRSIRFISHLGESFPYSAGKSVDLWPLT